MCERLLQFISNKELLNFMPSAEVVSTLIIMDSSHFSFSGCSRLFDRELENDSRKLSPILNAIVNCDEMAHII